MMKRTKMRASLLLGLIFLSPSAVLSDEPSHDELVRLGRLTTSAFACFAMAQGDAERLFLLGYESGLAFLEQVRKLDAVEYRAIRRQLPLLWAAALGPTHDFMLGALFTATVDNAMKNFVTDENMRKTQELVEYENRNCALLK